MIQLKMVLLALICATPLLTGCSPFATRTVLVPPGEPVRLRAATKASIWAADKNGKEVPGKVILPEGWYALPPPTSEPKPLKPVSCEFSIVRKGQLCRPDTGIVTVRSE